MTINTDLLHIARPEHQPGPVNPPIVRTSTVTFENLAQMREVKKRRAEGERLFSYGRRGTPTTHALEDAISRLEGGEQTQLLPSGVAAINLVLLTLLKPGDHLIVADSVYQPVRQCVQGLLNPWGIEVDYFDGSVEHLAALLRPQTRLIYTEVPGSLVYEMQDLSAITQFAQQHDIPVAVDNTWASGLLMQPLALGASISLMAGTKYVVGHSDVMLGTVTANGNIAHRLREMAITLGQCIGADDAYLALRGLRTLPCRMAQHAQTALQLGDWLAQQPGVAQIHQPSRQDHPGHEIWQRDCNGTNGLITIEFTTEITEAQRDAWVEALTLFGIGSSWGGYESLVLPVNPASARSCNAQKWQDRGPCVRLSIGLEDIDDLKTDLAQAWRVLQAD